MSASWRAVLFILVALIFAASVLGLYRSKAYNHGSFKAFYCAGKVLAQKKDPYLVEPLRSCERASGALLDPGEVEPAPLPAYALVPFALISRLSFAHAAAVLVVCAAAATLLSAVLLAWLIEAPAGFVLLVLMPLALLNIAYSELPVFSLAALVVCGWALKKQRWTLAAIAAAATLVQPQVAAPLILALLILAPPTRVALACALAVLAAVSIAVIGLPVNIEYFRQALPAQAASELVAADQYGLAHHLYILGFSGKAALLAGQVWAAIATVAGLFAAYFARNRLRAPEMIAFVPVAASLFGGVYLHDVQFIAALPAALVALVRVEPARRAACWLALTALTVVWTQRAERSVVVLDVLGAIGAACIFAQERTPRRIAAYAAAGVAVALPICALLVILHPAPGVAAVNGALSPAANDLAANAWAAYLRATPARNTESLLNMLSKLPTWIALLVVVAACALPRSEPRKNRTVVEAPASS